MDMIAVHGPHTWGQPFYAESDHIYVNMLGPYELEFKSKGIPNPLAADEYGWDFGDGIQTVDGYEVRHTYQQTGVFTVAMTVETTTGTITDTVEVTLDGNGFREIPQVEEEEDEAA
jgi:PKD domain